ncbi:aldehyde-activating protein [Marichromatium purpuratum 984]|uniref:Aldehyde-activating protein n=1 Tax=Marichromatium purpuratum 984 TaxID=765910 RepID=W0E4Q7_MARPU|nr:hypothetical protein [Marichromatium purpuratum]AHF04169.1 aldehyde-activating protein [Marichromatium purpuratum 984]
MRPPEPGGAFVADAMGWRLVSQLLIHKCNGNQLPTALRSSAHDFYDRRIVDIDDALPKQ